MKRLALILVLCIAAAAFAGCTPGNNVDDPTDARSRLPAVTNMAGETTSAEVCDDLTEAGLANVEVFEEWVLDFADSAGKDAGLTDRWVSPGAFTPDLDACMDGWESSHDYSDADCRMTAFLLLDGLLTAERTDSEYTGTYLMFDVDAIENAPRYKMINEKVELFTTLFGDRTPADGEEPSEVFGRVWDEYGFSIGSDNVSLLSIVFYDPDFDQVFVGHTGVLIDQGSVCLFVEKLAFEQPYQAIIAADREQLLSLLAAREEYYGSEGDAGPFVYINGEYLGELGDMLQDDKEGADMSKAERVVFERITLRIQGTMAWSQEYEVLRTDDGMEASYYEGSWMYNDSEEREDCVASSKTWTKDDYDELAAKLYDLRVPSWDGYTKSDPNALDGSSFSLEIALADGKTIYAHGTNAYPKNYGEFENCIRAACGQ